MCLSNLPEAEAVVVLVFLVRYTPNRSGLESCIVESTTSYTFPVQTGGIFYFLWHRLYYRYEKKIIVWNVVILIALDRAFQMEQNDTNISYMG